MQAFAVCALYFRADSIGRKIKLAEIDNSSELDFSENRRYSRTGKCTLKWKIDREREREEKERSEDDGVVLIISLVVNSAVCDPLDFLLAIREQMCAHNTQYTVHDGEQDEKKKEQPTAAAAGKSRRG